MENQNIIDLDDKINLIFDYIYNIKTTNKYTTKLITLGKISIDDIKISMVKSNSNNEIEFYNKNKNDILNGKFKIINNTNFDLIFKRYSDELSLLLKINFYTNDNEIDSFDSKINNDSLFSYILSDLVLKNITKHILLPLINLDIYYDDIKKIIYDDLIDQKIKDLINENKILNICCLQLRENFFKMKNLEEYVKDNTINYKSLLFQVIYTLAQIQNHYIGFCHNNLILKNIYVYLKKDNDNFNEYTGFIDDKFGIPNLNFDIKITNFENSYLPKYYGLNNKKSDKINPYFDIYIFLNDLLNFMKKNNKTMNKELTNFFNLYLPINIRDNFNDEIIIKPIDLIYDKFFEEYKIISKNNNDIKNINKKYSHIDINTKLESDNISYLGNQKNIKSHSNIMISDKINKRIINNFNNDILINRKLILNKIVGGADKIETSPYKVERNTPFISNDQRKINEIRSKENPIKEPPVLLEQKLYDTSQKPQPKPQFPPTFIPLYDQEGSIQNQLLPYSKIVNQPPVQKVYNVSLSNPLGNYSSINKIYEDVLPGNPFNYTSLTIYERYQLIEFLRNNILESIDGEEMTISGGKNSLLSYIKILDVNPYTIDKNPYIDLPRNFLLYRAAYPVRLENKSKTIGIAKPSMGINIRIYMMTYGDLNCKKIQFLDSENFDLWREIQYYDTIKNIIIKRKISPNFISPILYKIDSESNIDWNQLEIIKSRSYNNNITIQLGNNQKKVNDIHDLKKQFGLLSQFIPFQFRINDKTNTSNITKKIEIEKEDITVNSGKILILLTEAPTSNILQWASATYESFGSIKKMISTGYHTPDVWKSILFQLVYACSVLQEQIILIENLSLENNIYIKDIFSDPNSVGSWIYKVNNIEYFIPNYGYILVIDSKYADINIESNFINTQNTNKLQKFKIYGKIFKNNSIYNNLDELKPIIKEQFLNLINPDNFYHKLKIKGGSKPDESILNLLKNMWSDTECVQIKDYILKYFPNFLNNRIGTPLYKTEKENLNLFYRPNFNNYKGKLMAYQKRFQEFEWVLYVGDNIDNLRKDIIRFDNNKYINDSVFSNTLINYPDNEIILQENKKSMKYDESNIYEIYDLDNIKEI